MQDAIVLGIGQPFKVDRSDIFRKRQPFPVKLPSEAVALIEEYLSKDVDNMIGIGRSTESGVLEWCVQLVPDGVPLGYDYGTDLIELLRETLEEDEASEEPALGRIS